MIHSTQGQKLHMRYGKIEKENLTMSHYDRDSSANAVVLGDYGRVSFLYNVEKGWYMSITRHKRIKILNKSGYDHANIEIQYHDPGIGDSEKFISLRGVTYNDEGGKIVKSKLSKSAIFNERLNKYWKQRKFTMPDVKEGSIIEYEYTMESIYLKYLRAWEFQSSIPVVWSEYRLKIPEFFIYKTLMQGYHPLAINDRGRVDEEIDYSGGVTSGGPVRGGTRTFQSNTMRFVSTDVPAFKMEPHMTSRNNFISKMKFELSTIQFRGQLPKNMAKSWEDINREFLNSPTFGDLINGSGFLKKITNELTAGILDPEEKIRVIYNHVKSHMAWEGYYGMRANFTLKKAYEEKKGGVADINLILITMLRKAGIDADPVLLSTRDNGFVQTQFANSRQFNYVICLIRAGDQSILLDATDIHLPMTLLPKRCLNGKGFIISENNSGWVDLTASQKRLIKVSALMEISPEGYMKGNVKRVYDGYEARQRRQWYSEKGEEGYKQYRIDQLDGDVEEFTVEQPRDLDEKFVEKISFNAFSDIEDQGVLMYLNPMILLREDENPFKSANRKYPVNYGSKSENTFLLNLTIPEGYLVEETPENIAFTVAEGGAKFQYNVNVSGNKITVLSRLFINKTLFSQLEYGALKEFYTLVVSKHSEQIVLKKT